jgi:hypothetical protein
MSRVHSREQHRVWLQRLGARDEISVFGCVATVAVPSRQAQAGPARPPSSPATGGVIRNRFDMTSGIDLRRCAELARVTPCCRPYHCRRHDDNGRQQPVDVAIARAADCSDRCAQPTRLARRLGTLFTRGCGMCEPVLRCPVGRRGGNAFQLLRHRVGVLAEMSCHRRPQRPGARRARRG